MSEFASQPAGSRKITSRVISGNGKLLQKAASKNVWNVTGEVGIPVEKFELKVNLIRTHAPFEKVF